MIFSRKRKKSRWKRVVLIIVIIIFTSIFLAWALVDPIVTSIIRSEIESMEVVTGTIEGAELSLVDFNLIIKGTRLYESTDHEVNPPLLSSAAVRMSLSWDALLSGYLSGDARIENTTFAWMIRKGPEAKELEADAAAQALPAPLRVNEFLAAKFPFRLTRLEIQDSVIKVMDATEESNPHWTLDDLEVTIENFASRPHLAHDQPTTLTLRGRVQQSGVLSAFVNANPYAEKPTFQCQASLKNLRLEELAAFVAARTDLELTKGRFEAFVTLSVEQGKIEGKVRPVLSELEIESASPDLGDQIRVGLMDLAFDVFSDAVPQRDGNATVIPLEGTIDSPDVDFWTLVYSLLTNAFVEGLAAGFESFDSP